MKISYKSDYALKTLLELALNYNKGVVSIYRLAQRGDIPSKFLEQVLLSLKKAGFVDSKRGVSGGYFLVRPPDEIAIGEIIRFIEGHIEPITCVGRENYDGCKDFNSCVFKEIWNEMHMLTSNFIDNITFADLVDKVESNKNQGEGYTYYI